MAWNDDIISPDVVTISGAGRTAAGDNRGNDDAFVPPLPPPPLLLLPAAIAIDTIDGGVMDDDMDGSNAKGGVAVSVGNGKGKGDNALRCDALRTLPTLELLLNTLVLTLLVSPAFNCGMGDTDVTRVMIGGDVPIIGNGSGIGIDMDMDIEPIGIGMGTAMDATLLLLLIIRVLLPVLDDGVVVPPSTAGNTNDGDGVRAIPRVGNGDANRSAISAGTSANDGNDCCCCCCCCC